MTRRRAGIWITAALVCITVIVGGPGGGDVAAAVDGLSVEATTTYTLDADASVVHVRSEIELTNTSPPRHSLEGIYYSYFTDFAVMALGPTANVRASRDGVPLDVTVEEPDALADVIVVRLSPDLQYGAPQSLVVEYDLPGQPAGSDSPNRSNAAFASWYVAAVGDDGSARVVIDVPDRFTLETVTSAQSDTDIAGGRRVTTFEGLGETDGFFGVSAADDERLLVRSTTVDDDRFDIQAWPDDDAWADFAVDTVERGIPALVDFVGSDVAGERTITVAESGTPHLYGYAGWYSVPEDRVEVGDDRDRHTMLHELAHLWYHDGLFSSRWIVEGLAEVAATEATDAFDEEPLATPALDPGAPAVLRLNDWDHAAVGDSSGEADETGYRTSFAVIAAIHDLVGTETLQSVVARARRHELPLAGVADTDGPEFNDWRYLYDLLATSDGVDESAVEALFWTYVMTDTDRDVAAGRAAAMDLYRDLDLADGEWVPPVAVRHELAAWRFDVAADVINASSGVVDAAAQMRRLIEPLDVDADAVATAYETAEEVADLDELRDELPRYESAATDLAALDQRISDLGPLQRFGTLGRDVDARVEEAIRAFETGDLDAMDAIITRADEAVDQWPLVVGAWLGVLGGVVALTWLTWSRRAYRQPTVTAATATSEGAMASGVDGSD